MENEKWQIPKLKILSRLTPEEFILTACKQQQTSSARDPGTQVQMCGSEAAANCGACAGRGQS